MSRSRRHFIKGLGALGSYATWKGFQNKVDGEAVADAFGQIKRSQIAEAVRNEEIWKQIRLAFTVNPNLINLNNGGVSPQPKVVQDAVDRYYHYSNEGPSYYMWRILDQGREPLRQQLASLAGVDAEEIAIQRNTTEALDNVIFGLNLSPGDEVVLSRMDYPNMIHAWNQRALREGIVLKWLDFDLPQESEDYFVEAYRSAITPRTKVFHITHMINWTGQILPARKICDLAAEHGIFSLVDGAHTFAQLDFSIEQLHCDAFGTSLHKWLCAPFGTGMLYIRKNKIKEIWPLMPNDKPLSDNIRKFESLGTRSFAVEQAIATAIDFHEAIGAQLKQERLYYLSAYWAQDLANVDRLRYYTALNPHYTGALFNVGMEGLEASSFSGALLSTYKIHTSPIKWEQVDGVRITPHVYTSLKDLDRLKEALVQMAKS
jgi:selenocysteine lyase/cysteine desulfurase